MIRPLESVGFTRAFQAFTFCAVVRIEIRVGSETPTGLEVRHYSRPKLPASEVLAPWTRWLALANVMFEYKDLFGHFGKSPTKDVDTDLDTKTSETGRTGWNGQRGRTQMPDQR